MCYTEDSSQKIKYGIVAIMAAHQRCWLKSTLKYNNAILAKAKIRCIKPFTPAVENHPDIMSKIAQMLWITYVKVAILYWERNPIEIQQVSTHKHCASFTKCYFPTNPNRVGASCNLNPSLKNLKFLSECIFQTFLRGKLKELADVIQYLGEKWTART